MDPFENIDIEYKERYVPDIKKEVVAFANTEGGTIHIGIQNNGTVVGVDDPDSVMLQLSSALRDSIKPDVMSFVKIKTLQREDKHVVEVQVDVGTGRPYYLGDKGLKPAGVYVRKGSSSQPLSDEGIREMILQTSGRTYETCRSMNQALTFSTLQQEMEKRGQELGEAQMRTLHLLDADGLYTNLALLLSDQCEHTIKLAIFQGRDKAIFRDRKEFSGSLLSQLAEAYTAIDLFNKTKATFAGLERTDKRDYPEDAIREALLNSIVHRDYAFSGSTLINLYDDRIEFVSLGGLVPGLSMEAIFMGVSQSRNPHLAAVFYRMRLIESYGTGIGKIQRLYAADPVLPLFESAHGAFRVILANRNEMAEPAPVQREIDPPALTDPKERICSLAKKVGSVRRKDVEETLGLKTTAAHHLLKQLCEENRLRRVGNGRNSRYEPVN